MSIKSLKIGFFICFLGFAFLSNVSAQEGSYVTLSGIGQLTKLNNANDYTRRTSKLKPENTFKPAFSLRYTYVFKPNYGFETGIIYSKQGQRYSGTFDDSSQLNYESDISMNYLRIPVKFQFSSSLDADIKNVYLSIGIGFSVDVLTDVKVNTDPDFRTNGQNINYKDLYQSVSSSFVADAMLNIRLSDQWWIRSGLKMNFGLGDVENKGFNFPDNAPLEWYFPVSTKKDRKPNVQARERTRHSVFGFELGVAYRFGDMN